MVYFIGIDTSTTATKVLLINERGDVIGTGSGAYDFDTPQALWSEQNPELWWQATLEGLRSVAALVEPNQIVGIGLTGQMHGLVLLDGAGQVLRPAILWNDQRTAAQCDTIRNRLGKGNLIELTGNDALTGFTAPKIVWVQEHEPEIWAAARHILLPKDYVRYRLTGILATDRAGASGTLLFDLKKRDWSDEVLTALEIPRQYLPETHEGTDVTAWLSAESAALTGLPEGLPVFGGGGDQAAAAVGTGAVRSGVVSVSLGTSGVVFATTDQAAVEPEGRLHAFCHAVTGKWHLMGVMLSAAGSLRWYRDTLAPDLDFDDLLKPAESVPAGSMGLQFLPYLSGERTPHPDPLARGAFVGLSIRHEKAHMTRAVLEGVAFGLRDSFELMKSAGLADVSQVRVTGGGARSPLWRQILADVFGTEIATVNAQEGAAYGAALLAGVGSGAWADVPSACNQVIRITSTTSPGPSQSEYDIHYAVYRELYPALKDSFAKLASG
jgi:xylulokinase